MSAFDQILLSRADLAIPHRRQLHYAVPVLALQEAAAEVRDVHQGAAHLLQPSAAVDEFMRRDVTRHTHGVYSFPYLSQPYCALIRGEFERHQYNVNADEEPEAQIPEIVLKYRCYPLHQSLATLWASVGSNVAQLLLNLECEKDPSSIQLAKYKAGTGNQGTVWHHDEDSDCTLVVNLGTYCKGGGTLIAGAAGSKPVLVPNLPAGHALLFPGRSTLHSGVPVTAGTRDLLVHWVKTV